MFMTEKICRANWNKAFDSADHFLLDNELAALSTTESAMHWVESFLSNRSFSIRVGN